MVAFAWAWELGQFIGTEIPDDALDGADLILDMATSLIQDEAGQQISFVANDSVELRGTWEDTLRLPQRPVTAISAMRIRNGSVWASEVPLQDQIDYRWDRMGKVRRVSYVTGRLIAPAAGYWGGDKAVVDVTYSHGYTVVPDRAKALCLAVAARFITNPKGVVRETTGPYTVMFDRSVPGFTLTDHEKKVARRLGKAA